MAEQDTSNTILQASRFLPPLALRSVTAPNKMGVFASSGELYAATFGRDSLTVHDHLVGTNRTLARRILLGLASLQGEVYNPLNEEEPGKTIHESRTSKINGRLVRGEASEIFKKMSAAFGGDDEQVDFYGSIDATPHFVRSVGEYIHHYGDALLRERVALRSGYPISMSIAVENSMTWILKKLSESESGLLEYKRLNDALDLNPNQAWKDSKESFIHRNGKLANHRRPIAAIEVQSLTYDALLTAASIFPHRADEYQKRAAELRDKTIKYMWLPEEHYFALGTDYDDQGQVRLIETKMANAASLLNSYFFYDLTEPERQKYVGGIVKTIMSEDFVTAAGIRSRSLSEAHLVPFWDYHGSFVSWPKETFDIAKGLRRHGFPALARQLENRLLNVCLRNLAYPEFIYVDAEGNPLPVRPSVKEHAGVKVIDAPNKPEAIQAWTVSSIIAILNQRTRAKLLGRHEDKSHGWQAEIEAECMGRIPHINRTLNLSQLRKRYPQAAYRLNSTRW